jgi:hypothetical protein
MLCMYVENQQFIMLIILLIKKCAFFDPLKLRQPMVLLIFALQNNI